MNQIFGKTKINLTAGDYTSLFFLNTTLSDTPFKYNKRNSDNIVDNIIDNNPKIMTISCNYTYDVTNEKYLFVSL